MNFQGKITALQHVEGNNMRGEHYSGSRITVVEQNAPEGHRANAVTCYVSDTYNASTGSYTPAVQMGDLGTVEVTIDLKQGNNGAYNTVSRCSFTLTQPATF